MNKRKMDIYPPDIPEEDIKLAKVIHCSRFIKDRIHVKKLTERTYDSMLNELLDLHDNREKIVKLFKQALEKNHSDENKKEILNELHDILFLNVLTVHQ